MTAMTMPDPGSDAIGLIRHYEDRGSAAIQYRMRDSGLLRFTRIDEAVLCDVILLQKEPEVNLSQSVCCHSLNDRLISAAAVQNTNVRHRARAFLRHLLPFDMLDPLLRAL